MIRVAPRFLITVLALSAAMAFGAAAHGPVAPDPEPELSTPQLLQELGRRVGLGPSCACDASEDSGCAVASDRGAS